MPPARPSSGNTYADVEAAYDYLVAKGIPPNRCPLYAGGITGGGFTCSTSNVPKSAHKSSFSPMNMVFLFGFMVCIDGL